MRDSHERKLQVLRAGPNPHGTLEQELSEPQKGDNIAPIHHHHHSGNEGVRRQDAANRTGNGVVGSKSKSRPTHQDQENRRRHLDKGREQPTGNGKLKKAVARPQVVKKVFCLFDFAPENDDELGLRAGDRVEILQRQDPDGWVQVRVCSLQLLCQNQTRNTSHQNLRGAFIHSGRASTHCIRWDHFFLLWNSLSTGPETRRYQTRQL